MWPFGNRSIHKQLVEQSNKQNAKRLDGQKYTTPRVVSPIEAATAFINDGIDYSGQGQYIMRERGMSVAVSGKADFGKLTPCPILCLELGVSAKLDVLGKRTLLLYRGPDYFDVEQTQSSSSPIVVGCLEGWKTEIGGGASAKVGIGFGVGVGAGASKDGVTGKVDNDKPSWTKSDDDEPEPAKLAIAEAKAEFFAGIQAEASAGYEYYYASDDNVFLTWKDPNSNESTVHQLVEEVIKEGTVKSGIKRSAVRLIHDNPSYFVDAGSVKYDTWGGLSHISSTDTIAALSKQKGKLPAALKERVNHLIWGLLPFSGSGKKNTNITAGLTYVRICGPKGAASAKLGASCEASCSSPLFSAKAGLEANAFNVSTSSKRLYLSYQGVAGFTPRDRPFVYFQDFTFKYSKSELKFGELTLDAKMKMKGVGKVTLDDGIKALKGKETEKKKEVAELMKELTKVWEFGAHEGASVTAAAMSASTVTYKGVCFFYEQPSKEEVKSAKNYTVTLGKGSGYVQGTTFTIGLLANISEALEGCKKLLTNFDEYFSDSSAKAKFKTTVAAGAKEELEEAISAFRTLLATMGGILGVTLNYFFAFLKTDLEGIEEGLFANIAAIDPGKGVLVEAAFSLTHTAGANRSHMKPGQTSFKKFERTIALDVNQDAMGRSDNPPVHPPTVPTKASIKEFVETGIEWTSPGKRRTPPQQIRLRCKIGMDADSSVTLPLGLSVGIAEVSLKIKNVWHLEVEGVPMLKCLSFDQNLVVRDSVDSTKEIDLSVARPLIFCL